MNTRKRIKTILALAIMAMALISGATNAAVITTSTTAPTVDATDESNLVAQTGLLKWFSDIEHDAGQTFTPGEDVKLNSFTIRLGADNVDEGGEWVNVRLGTITRPGGVFTFTDIYSDAANLNGDWFAGDYVTYTFDTPQILTGGTEYGIITDAQNMGDWHVGIPYLSLGGSSYADGHAIGRGSPRNDDLVFHADLDPSTTPPLLPDVDAGDSWITWSDQAVTLDPNVVNNDEEPQRPLSYAWSANPSDGVVFDPNSSIEAPTVTITKATANPSVVTLTLSVTLDGEIPVEDTMTIDVYDDSCEAAKGVGTAVSFDSTDLNTDCITNLEDFGEVAMAWLVDYALTGPAAK